MADVVKTSVKRLENPNMVNHVERPQEILFAALYSKAICAGLVREAKQLYLKAVDL